MQNKDILIAAWVQIGALVLFCAFSAIFITPLRKERAVLKTEIESAKARLLSQSAEFHALLAEEARQIAEPDDAMNRLYQSLPLPAHVAVPALLNDILRRNAISSPQVNLMANLLFPGTPEFGLYCWKIHASPAPIPEIAHALAELENRQPMAQISDIQLKEKRLPPFLEIVVQIPAPR